MDSRYEAVIGLEVHAQLSTKSKLFCSCSARFGAEPNTSVCPICLGHPGVLPVLNQEAVRFAVMMGLAVEGKINENSFFARKNYFYPDLPKGYQISQLENPVVEAGRLTLSKDGEPDTIIRINRIHLEEDAGKSIHDRGEATLVDVNRCGVPLIEIVSEPDIRSAQDAAAYLMKIRKLVRYLGICDGNMEEGSLRCDANVSIRLKGETILNEKTEIKNMNSFKNVEKAIEYEIDRQIDFYDAGKRIVSETLLWNADEGKAYSMRSKEEAHDYRYFPEPDLLPIKLSSDFVNEIRRNMVELPDVKYQKFINKYSLPIYDSALLTNEISVALYFEQGAELTTEYKLLSNWVMTEVLKYLNDNKINISEFPIKPDGLAELVNLIGSGAISGKIAKDVFTDMIATGDSAKKIVKEKNLAQVSDISEIRSLVLKLLAENQSEVEQFLAGKDKVIGSFVGKAMKATGGKINPKVFNEVLMNELNSLKK